MDAAPPGDVTRLIRAASSGEKTAIDRLLPLIHEELKVVATRYMSRERPDHTLQPTALVNEAYLRLIGGENPEFADRRHFVAIAARRMRQVLVDYAKQHAALKRGGDHNRVSMNDLTVAGSVVNATDAIALDESLRKLETDANSRLRRAAEMVELRLFGGLSSSEIADELGVSKRTVERDLKAATVVLLAKLSD